MSEYQQSIEVFKNNISIANEKIDSLTNIQQHQHQQQQYQQQQYLENNDEVIEQQEEDHVIANQEINEQLSIMKHKYEDIFEKYMYLQSYTGNIIYLVILYYIISSSNYYII